MLILKITSSKTDLPVNREESLSSHKECNFLHTLTTSAKLQKIKQKSQANEENDLKSFLPPLSQPELAQQQLAS